MNNADIAIDRIKNLHAEILSLDSSNTSILKESLNVELFIDKASRDTNGYRKRLTAAYEILENRPLDEAIVNGLDGNGLNKDLIEDLMFARRKPIDKALEHLRTAQQDFVNLSIAKKDLVHSTRQINAQLKIASKKITHYERSLGDIMTFLSSKGLLDTELLNALNGSIGAVTEAILDIQNKKKQVEK